MNKNNTFHEGSVDAIIDQLEEKEYNENSNWQNDWKSKCSRLCCWSPDCADIVCAGCIQSIVRPLPPRSRYVCLECDLSLVMDSGDHGSIDYCPSCFEDINTCHVGSDKSPHTKWLKIDPSGIHSLVTRTAAQDVKVAEITKEDLFHHQVDVIQNPDDCCPVMCCDYTSENPKCSPPGCPNPEHAFCSDCTLDDLRANNRAVYFQHAHSGAKSPSPSETKSDTSVANSMPPATYFCRTCNEEYHRQMQITEILKEVTLVIDLFEKELKAHTTKTCKTIEGSDLISLAASALAQAPSLQHREITSPSAKDYLNRSDDSPANSNVQYKKIELIKWASAELKKVHAGARNIHLHKALDNLLR